MATEKASFLKCSKVLVNRAKVTPVFKAFGLIKRLGPAVMTSPRGILKLWTNHPVGALMLANKRFNGKESAVWC